MPLREMSDNQRRILIDAVQLFEAHEDALLENRPFKGGMHWKKSKGREYLFRTRDRHGYGNSLGLRTQEQRKS